MSKFMYKNKKFDPQNPSAEPEKLPLVRFLLDDTTSKIPCVCFPKLEELDKFESIEVYGVSDYEHYLTQLYGDWRQLPPKEKRQTAHLQLDVDLNHSFLASK